MEKSEYTEFENFIKELDGIQCKAVKKSEYNEIENFIEELDDIRCKAVFRFIIAILRDINPGNDDAV